MLRVWGILSMVFPLFITMDARACTYAQAPDQVVFFEYRSARLDQRAKTWIENFASTARGIAGPGCPIEFRLFGRMEESELSTVPTGLDFARATAVYEFLKAFDFPKAQWSLIPQGIVHLDSKCETCGANSLGRAVFLGAAHGKLTNAKLVCEPVIDPACGRTQICHFVLEDGTQCSQYWIESTWPRQ